MNDLMTVSTYSELKQAFDGEIHRQSEGFVRMGYLLRHAEDTNILSGSSYKTIAEFAKAEYNLTEDTVSRLIAINKRYSEGGYSDRLQEKYQGYKSTLLAEMLTISDSVIDALPPGVTREEIREIKKEIREENQTSDLEVWMEGEDSRQQAIESNLAKVLHQYYRDNTREYPDLFKEFKHGGATDTALQLLAPSGIGTKMVRIQGIGKFMLSIKGQDQNLDLVNLRTNEKESYTWQECAGILQSMCEGKTYKAAFETLYGKPYPEPEKKEIAPAQEPKAPETKPNPPKSIEKQPETEIPPASEPEKEPAAPVNTGHEGIPADPGNDLEESDHTEEKDPEPDIQQESEEKPKDNDGSGETPTLAPAQVHSDPDKVEVIESPYKEHKEKAEETLIRIRALLEDEDYHAAHRAAKLLEETIKTMVGIQEEQNAQMDGQISIQDYDE